MRVTLQYETEENCEDWEQTYGNVEYIARQHGTGKLEVGFNDERNKTSFPEKTRIVHAGE